MNERCRENYFGRRRMETILRWEKKHSAADRDNPTATIEEESESKNIRQFRELSSSRLFLNNTRRKTKPLAKGEIENNTKDEDVTNQERESTQNQPRPYVLDMV